MSTFTWGGKTLFSVRYALDERLGKSRNSKKGNTVAIFFVEFDIFLGKWRKTCRSGEENSNFFQKFAKSMKNLLYIVYYSRKIGKIPKNLLTKRKKEYIIKSLLWIYIHGAIKRKHGSIW